MTWTLHWLLLLTRRSSVVCNCTITITIFIEWLLCTQCLYGQQSYVVVVVMLSVGRLSTCGSYVCVCVCVCVHVCIFIWMWVFYCVGMYIFVSLCGYVVTVMDTFYVCACVVCLWSYSMILQLFLFLFIFLIRTTFSHLSNSRYICIFTVLCIA